MRCDLLPEGLGLLIHSKLTSGWPFSKRRSSGTLAFDFLGSSDGGEGIALYSVREKLFVPLVPLGAMSLKESVLPMPLGS